MLKKFFGRSQDASKIDSSDLTVDELIVLERWEEARERLEKEVKKHKGDPPGSHATGDRLRCPRQRYRVAVAVLHGGRRLHARRLRRQGAGSAQQGASPGARRQRGQPAALRAAGGPEPRRDASSRQEGPGRSHQGTDRGDSVCQSAHRGREALESADPDPVRALANRPSRSSPF